MGIVKFQLPNLLRARKSYPLKQTELMERAGIKSRTTLSRIENGKSASLDTARRLAEALGVSLEYLKGEAKPVPLDRAGHRSRPTIDVLEERLSQLQEYAPKDWHRWALLQAQAQLLLERTWHEETRERAEEVARRAYHGQLDALGIDRNDPDAIQAIDEMLDDSRSVAENREKTEVS